MRSSDLWGVPLNDDDDSGNYSFPNPKVSPRFVDSHFAELGLRLRVGLEITIRVKDVLRLWLGLRVCGLAKCESANRDSAKRDSANRTITNPNPIPTPTLTLNNR